MNQNLRSWIEIDKAALLNNIKQIKTLIKNKKLAIILKSNAYGHGLIPIAKIVNTCSQVDYICVVGIQEALTLRNIGITKEILALAHYDAPIEEAILKNIELTVYNKKTLEDIKKAAKKINIPAKIHLKFDTGLGRLGFTLKDINYISKALQTKSLELTGILTHLSDNINANPEKSKSQLKLFNKILEEFKNNNFKNILIHALSSGTSTFDYTQNICPTFTQMVRMGTNAYGIYKSPEQKKLFESAKVNLKQILTWKSKIIEIKNIKAGESIGYGNNFTAQENIKIAIIPIGYADGYPQNLSNKAFIKINKNYAKSIGLISMNLLAIDITNIPEAQINSEIILTGNYPKISLPELSKLSETKILEILTKINPEIIRIEKTQIQPQSIYSNKKILHI